MYSKNRNWKSRTPKLLVLCPVVIGCIVLTGSVAAQDAPPVRPKAGTDYSPYPEQNFPNRVFFGDAHLHTSYSADAGMIGNTLGPDEAYRFAKGETVTSSTGVKARLARPLDFLVVADHAENLGLAPLLAAGDPKLLATEFGKVLKGQIDAGNPAGAWTVSYTHLTLPTTLCMCRSRWSPYH